MSSASAPDASQTTVPVAPGPVRPSVVQPGRRGPRRLRILLSAGLLAVVAVAGGLYLKSRPAARKTGTAGVVSIRTTTAIAGDLHRTVRVSGTIQAEKFSAIMAPHLHGSHSGRGRGGGMAGNANLNVAQVDTSSLGTSGVSSGSSSGAAPAGGGSASDSGGSDSGGDSGASAGSGGSRGSRMVSNNRTMVSGSSRGSRSGGGGGGSGDVSVASLGSTSGSLLRGGGGMGRGGSDFMLVLQDVAPAGSRVQKGQTIAEFDRQYQLLRLDDYKDSVTQLAANVRKLKADLDVARDAHEQLVKVRKADLDKSLLDLKTKEVRSAIDAERLRLFAQQSQEAYDEALAEVKSFEQGQQAQLKAAEIDLDQARIELKRATANVDRMVLKAPIEGIVVMQSIFRGGDWGQIRQGDQVAPGMLFMSVVEPASMILNATVNQTDSEMLRLGQQASVHLDAYPDIDLPATVIGIGAMTKPGGFRASYVREIPIRLKLDKMDARVIPDLSASADIVIASEPGVVMAPREAVFRDSPERPFVFIKQAAGWIRREVETGLENNIMVAVRSGLRKGDVLAVQRPQS